MQTIYKDRNSQAIQTFSTKGLPNYLQENEHEFQINHEKSPIKLDTGGTEQHLKAGRCGKIATDSCSGESSGKGDNLPPGKGLELRQKDLSNPSQWS